MKNKKQSSVELLYDELIAFIIPAHTKIVEDLKIKQQLIINMTDAEKENLIQNIYFKKAGFQSIYNTFKEVKTKDPSITLENVKNWFDKNILKTKQISGSKNSYVAPNAYFEYQADLFFITEK